MSDSLGLSGALLLDRYQVGAAIALGGMALIYRGQDLRLLRPVCIKVFHRLSCDASGYRTSYEHFVQEAFALSQLSHPHTLRIYDFGHLDRDTGAPFQIAELLEGGTLGQMVRREGPRPPAEVIDIIEPVTGALGEAHARGIVHRDIKPSNILFGLAGAHRIVKLCDFGIAKSNDDAIAPPHRASDTVVADGARLHFYSRGWAAPEQMRGDPVGPRADIFSLALVAAFLLTGRPLFPPHPPEDLPDPRSRSDAHIAERLDTPAIPPALAAVLQRACRESPAARHATASAFAAALRQAQGSDPAASERVQGSDPSASERVQGSDPSASERVQGSDPRPQTMGGRRLPLAAPPEATPVLRVDLGSEADVVVAGRRVRLIPVIGGQLDLGADTPWLESKARFRVTVTPSFGANTRLNIRGLNCFVARPDARPTTAVDVEDDMQLAFLATDQRPIDGMRCMLGVSAGAARRYEVGHSVVVVSANAALALIDLGPGRELALLHTMQPPHRGVRR